MTTKVDEIDIRGQVCPSSLLLALIPTAVENMGLCTEVEKKDGYYRILVRK